jgi:hypothetical protein
MMITGPAPGWSSSGLKSRPSARRPPSTEKKSADTRRASTRSASPAPVRLNAYPRMMAMAENVWLSLCQSTKFGYGIAPFLKLGLL